MIWFDRPTSACYTFAVSRGCSSAGRARQSHCRGQEFEPPHLHHDNTRSASRPHGAVAQLGERNTGSVEVRSSILLSSTKVEAACRIGKRSLLCSHFSTGVWAPKCLAGWLQSICRASEPSPRRQLNKLSSILMQLVFIQEMTEPSYRDSRFYRLCSSVKVTIAQVGEVR
jgi:hypothetical protein